MAVNSTYLSDTDSSMIEAWILQIDDAIDNFDIDFSIMPRTPSPSKRQRTDQLPLDPNATPRVSNAPPLSSNTSTTSSGRQSGSVSPKKRELELRQATDFPLERRAYKEMQNPPQIVKDLVALTRSASIPHQFKERLTAKANPLDPPLDSWFRPELSTESPDKQADQELRLRWKYTEEDMAEAILDVTDNGFSPPQAAQRRGVPRSTLIDRPNGRGAVKEQVHPYRRLSKNQEDRLAFWILRQESLGYAPSHNQVRACVIGLLRQQGEHSELGRNWVTRFINRRTDLKTKMGRRQEANRFDSFTPKAVHWYFDIRERQYGWIKPENTVNVDEGGLDSLIVGSADPKRKAYLKGPQTRNWTSFIEAVTADGRALIPGIEWFERVYLPQTTPADDSDARLIILDGHGSHETHTALMDSNRWTMECSMPPKPRIDESWKSSLLDRFHSNGQEIQEDRPNGSPRATPEPRPYLDSDDTPQTSRQIRDLRLNKTPKTRRRYNVIAKGFEAQQQTVAAHTARIASLEEELARLKRGKKRKAVPNPNKRFMTLGETLAGGEAIAEEETQNMPVVVEGGCSGEPESESEAASVIEIYKVTIFAIMKFLSFLAMTLGFMAVAASEDNGGPDQQCEIEYVFERPDKNDALLLVVDLQVGLYSLARDFDPTLYRDQMLAHVALGKVFDLPAILMTSAENGPNGPLPKEILEMHPDAPLVQRQGEVNAWDNQEFRDAVKAANKSQIIMAGITTDACTTFLALSLREEGYSVWANVEASGTTSPLVSDISNDRMAKAGVHTASLFSIACDLMRDWRNTPGAKEMIPWLDKYVPVWGYVARSHEAAVNNGTIKPGEESLN
ncbi:hypothetical protein FOXYSP1_17677 [Fusarium oxysporum f. sp. phaseoli]